MFYHKDQGFVHFTVDDLRQALDQLPAEAGDWLLNPSCTYQTGFVFSVQNADADGNWFIGYIDPVNGEFHQRDRGQRVVENPVYGPIHTIKEDDTILENVNVNYPRLAS